MDAATIKPGPGDVLLVVDLQVDFLPGGRLGVPGGDEVVPLANRLARAFPHVVLTQDWHPADHLSFAAMHPGRAPFEIVDMPYGGQILWPEHCVQGLPGAAFAPELDIPHAGLVLRKGWNRAVDSYSAFNEADGTPTGLAGYLAQRGVSRVFLLGLATDFCVAWSALDAAREGFAVAVIEDACRAIDLAGSCAAAWEQMAATGIGRLDSAAFATP
jgi:nicotinamidase/pyrazinamidase